MQTLLQIPKKARVSIEFLVVVGAVVVGLSVRHEIIAYTLGAAAFLVLLLDLFGEAAWNGLSVAVVRSAAAKGLFDPPDPGAISRVRELRAALLHVLTELQDVARWIEGAIRSGEFWQGAPDVFYGGVWHQHSWFIASEQGFESLYETLASAYHEVARINYVAQAARSRPVQVGHQQPVHPEDGLAFALAKIEEAERALHETVARLSRR